jgi:hypothetical protein
MVFTDEDKILIKCLRQEKTLQCSKADLRIS